MSNSNGRVKKLQLIFLIFSHAHRVLASRAISSARILPLVSSREREVLLVRDILVGAEERWNNTWPGRIFWLEEPVFAFYPPHDRTPDGLKLLGHVKWGGVRSLFYRSRCSSRCPIYYCSPSFKGGEWSSTNPANFCLE